MSGIIGGLLIFGSALVSQVPHVINEVFAREPESVEALVSRVAEEEGVASTTLYNLAWSESHLDPSRTSETNDRGLVQISSKYHAEVSDKCAYNAECSLRWASKRIKDGYVSEWTVCNCFSYASLFVKLPKMAEIKPNSALKKNAVAIFYYKKTKHLAVVSKIEEKGFWVKEANKTPCLVSERFIPWGDSNLAGFWSASP